MFTFCIRLFHEIRRDQRGLTTVEYVIVLCLVAAVAVGTWGKLGKVISEGLGGAKDDIAKELGAKKS
jgi:Flp pilus assembly pilin Flp